MTDQLILYVILMGSPSKGFSVIGPFDTVSEAREYIYENAGGGAMWILELRAPT
jgi:hypothetical protein